MRIIRSIQLVMGSASVYLVVAACGSGQRATDVVANEDSGSSSSGGGGPGSSGAVGLFDAIASPEGQAFAAPPDVSSESCDKTTGTTTYAEHLYPGKTIDQLSFVVARIHYTASAQLLGGAYQDLVSPVFVKDGAVAVACAPTNTDHVTFILPSATP